MKAWLVALLISSMMSAIAAATVIAVTVGNDISFSSVLEAKHGNITTILVSVENTGSLKCRAQAKVEDGEQKFWSEKADIEPGGYVTLPVYYVSPYNESRNLSVYVYFCDYMRKIGSLTAEPSGMKKGDVRVEITEGKGFIKMKGNATVIPFNNPLNVNIPTEHVNGEKVVRIYYPEHYMGNITFILSNGTAYQLVTVEPSRNVPWIPIAAGLAAIAAFYALLRMLLHGRPGRAENGRRHPAKGKRRAKRKNKA